MTDTIALTGNSSNFYLFHKHSLDELNNLTNGVYIIYSNVNKPSESLIYIGETGNASKRFKDHHKEDCFSKFKNIFTGFLKTTSKEERKNIETDLLLKYKTPCNEKLN